MALTLTFSLPTSATRVQVGSFKRLPSQITTVKAVGVFPSKIIDHKRAIRLRPCSALNDLVSAVTDTTTTTSTTTTTVTRDDFPTDFIFGCASSAFQTEGSGTEGGRGPATWDNKIVDKAIDSYNRYKEDVQLLVNMGVDTYRLSISWSRLLPDGTIDGGINQEGIDFYNNFINELIANGITPFVTLFHFDLPVPLDTKYGGFLSFDIVEDFKVYADLCFKTFGDRVKHWVTINEPQVWAPYGVTRNDPIANVATYPFVCMHNIILAHATTAKLYKSTYQPTQGGEIGIPIQVEWFEPYEVTPQDASACQRAFDFFVGWVLEPLVYGDYPFIMKALVGDDLPTFTDEQKELVKGSYDFIGVNYYTSNFAANVPKSNNDVYNVYNDYWYVIPSGAGSDGQFIGPPTPGSPQIYVYPNGLKKSLIALKNYNDPKIYITENGYADLRDDTLTVKEASVDDARIQHIQSHLTAIKDAMNIAGTNVNGYIMWTLTDCLEMGSGLTVRFGLNYTDYLNDLARTPKKSAGWLKEWLAASSSTTST